MKRISKTKVVSWHKLEIETKRWKPKERRHKIEEPIEREVKVWKNRDEKKMNNLEEEKKKDEEFTRMKTEEEVNIL